MSKTKEYYMSINDPNLIDVEREYLINDILAQEQEYLEYEEIKNLEEVNIINSKIEIKNVREIKISKEEYINNKETTGTTS